MKNNNTDPTPTPPLDGTTLYTHLFTLSPLKNADKICISQKNSLILRVLPQSLPGHRKRCQNRETPRMAFRQDGGEKFQHRQQMLRERL